MAKVTRHLVKAGILRAELAAKLGLPREDELSGRGVKFKGPVEDHGYGLVTHFKVPGGFEVQLYQPRYK